MINIYDSSRRAVRAFYPHCRNHCHHYWCYRHRSKHVSSMDISTSRLYQVFFHTPMEHTPFLHILAYSQHPLRINFLQNRGLQCTSSKTVDPSSVTVRTFMTFRTCAVHALLCVLSYYFASLSFPILFLPFPHYPV